MSLESINEIDSASRPWIAQLHFESSLDEQAQSQVLPILANEELRIGRLRDKGCTYTLNHEMVSKQHFRIYSIIYDTDPDDPTAELPKPPLIFCEDLESSNGTYVNNELIGIYRRKANSTGYLLTDGDVIEIKPFWKFVFSQPDTRDKQGPKRSIAITKELALIQQKSYIVSNRCFGSGTYGAVYLAKNVATRKQVACKIMEFEGWRRTFFTTKSVRGEKISATQTKDQMRERALREIKILSKLSHPNVIDLKKAFVSGHSIYMFFELAGGGDLFEYIRHHGGVLSDVHSRVITRQIAFAVEFIHSRGVVHRDIKPENILLERKEIGCRVMLADFGLAIDAQSGSSRMESVVGTSGYTAPEVRSDNTTNGYTMAADMFSFGLVTLLTLTGTTTITETGYSRNDASEITNDFLYAQLKWEDISSSARKFLRRLLDPIPENRIQARQAVEHCWFTDPRGHDPSEADNAYQRSIQYWQCRNNHSKVIGRLPGSGLHKEMRDVRKPHKKLPDATASPYFNLTRHLEQKPRSRRKRVLAEIAQTGQPFLADAPNRNELANWNVEIRSRSVNGSDLFGTTGEIKIIPDSQETPGSFPHTSSRRRRPSRKPQSPFYRDISRDILESSPNSSGSDNTPLERAASSNCEAGAFHDTTAGTEERDRKRAKI